MLARFLLLFVLVVMIGHSFQQGGSLANGTGDYGTGASYGTGGSDDVGGGAGGSLILGVGANASGVYGDSYTKNYGHGH